LHLPNLLFGAEPVFQFVTVFSATLLVEFVRATANLVFKSFRFYKRRGCAESARSHAAFLVALSVFGGCGKCKRHHGHGQLPKSGARFPMKITYVEKSAFDAINRLSR